MRNILKNRLALSTVVTTLIILVVSVLLAGVVTYFAINVTSTRVQQESLSLMKSHIWYAQNGTGYTSEAAVLVINTGGRDVVLQKVTVRGQTVPWTSIFSNVTGASIADDLAFQTTLADKGTVSIGSSGNFTVSQASTDVTLPSGKSMLIYIANPDSVTVNDIGLTVGITVFTSQAMYYQEANVQSS